LNQPWLARLFEIILADELRHVAGGLRWSKAVAEKYGFDVITERDNARNHYLARETHERLRFLVNCPDRAIAEADELRLARNKRPNAIPFTIELEEELRRQVGFTEDDIRQIREWKIYPASTRAVIV
jgi:uncharacterized ferritin-like protein (DUF455 family)